MKKAIITGITGQDGSYLAELLLTKGYEVHGIIRRTSNFNTQRIEHLYKDPHDKTNLFLHYGDLLDGGVIARLLEEHQPNEFYNLGAQSHVRVSFDIPELTGDVVGLGCLRALAAIKNYSPHTRFYQASSSELFGQATEVPQSEKTLFQPRSPYACAKAYAHYTTINYREAYNLFACCGILFNHESPRRAETFVTRKVTRAATRIKLGLQEKLYLGNLDAKRDWGYAKEFVGAMWQMLQQDKPEEFVIATGETHSVKELVEVAFARVDLNWKDYVVQDSRYLRPTEVNLLQGDSSHAKLILGWQPKTSFLELIHFMEEKDLMLAKTEKLVEK